MSDEPQIDRFGQHVINLTTPKRMPRRGRGQLPYRSFRARAKLTGLAHHGIQTVMGLLEQEDLGAHRRFHGIARQFPAGLVGMRIISRRWPPPHPETVLLAGRDPVADAVNGHLTRAQGKDNKNAWCQTPHARHCMPCAGLALWFKTCQTTCAQKRCVGPVAECIDLWPSRAGGVEWSKLGRLNLGILDGFDRRILAKGALPCQLERRSRNGCNTLL